jgi:hypothetical protein
MLRDIYFCFGFPQYGILNYFSARRLSVTPTKVWERRCAYMKAFLSLSLSWGETEATVWPIAPASDDDWSNWWNVKWQGNRITQRKPPPVPICPPQIPQDLTRACTVGNQHNRLL